MVFCRLGQPALMADLSEIALPTRFVFLVLTPQDEGPNAIWEISEMGRSLGSMLGDKVSANDTRGAVMPLSSLSQPRRHVGYTYCEQNGVEMRIS